MASPNYPNNPPERHTFIATNVAQIYADLLSISTVARINSLPSDVAGDMAAEVELQMQKMQSLKALLEVRIREARREEERRRSSTVDLASGELQRARERSQHR